MSRVTENKRPWLAYTLYAVVLTLALLYLLFPSQQVKDFLQAKAENSSFPLHVSIGEVSPSLAFGLHLRGTEFSPQTAPDKTLLRADRLFVRPAVWTFLQGSFKVCFDGLVNDGSLEGCVRFDEDDPEAPFSTSATLRDIRLGKFEELSNLMGRHIEGSLEGSLSYDGEIESLTEGAGEADLRVFNGRIELRQPVLSFDVIEFSEVSIRLTLKNRKMKLTHVELKGPNIYGTLSGTISTRREFLDSSLDLKGTVDPSEGFFEGSEGASVTIPLLVESLGGGSFPFAIRGTLKKPRFDLI